MVVPADLLLPIVPGLLVLVACGAMVGAVWRDNRKRRRAERKARGFKQCSHVSVLDRGSA